MTGSPVLGSGEIVTGGPVVTRSLVDARGPTARPEDHAAGCKNWFVTHCFPRARSRRCTRYRQKVLRRIVLALPIVFDSRGYLMNIFHTSFFILHQWWSATAGKIPDDTLSGTFFFRINIVGLVSFATRSPWGPRWRSLFFCGNGLLKSASHKNLI